MQEDKSATVKDMQMADGAVRLLFATEAYSMGTDAPNIRRIVHVGVPYSMEDKLHDWCTKSLRISKAYLLLSALKTTMANLRSLKSRSGRWIMSFSALKSKPSSNTRCP